MAPGFPTLPLSQIQSEDIKKTYHLMYKHIVKEFVHWDDLKTILQNGNLQIQTLVNGGAVAQAPTGSSPVVAAQGIQTQTEFVYQDKASGLSRIADHESEAQVPGSREAFKESVKAGTTGPVEGV